jgi:hypothetical protein
MHDKFPLYPVIDPLAGIVLPSEIVPASPCIRDSGLPDDDKQPDAFTEFVRVVDDESVPRLAGEPLDGLARTIIANTIGLPPPDMGTASDPDKISPLAVREHYQERFLEAGQRIEELPEDDVGQVVSSLAPKFHESWQHTYIKDHRTGEGSDDFTPRWKPVGDNSDWFAKAQADPRLRQITRQHPDTGIQEVDIARASFDELPAIPWKIDTHG